MTDLPIIFSARMVRALLEGRKTQTRRPAWNGEAPSRWQRAKPGDRIYVRETHWRWGRWLPAEPGGGPADKRRPGLRFRPARPEVAFDEAPLPAPDRRDRLGWWKRPGIFLPRAASRLTLTVTAVSLERLQDLGEADALAEGCFELSSGRFVDEARDQHFGDYWYSARAWYQEVWDELHGPGAWDRNPEVVALTFTVHQGNIDRLGRT